MREYHPISVKDQSRLHQFGEKVLFGMFFSRCALFAGGIWTRQTGRRHRGAGTFGRVRNPCSETHYKVVIPKNGEHFIFPIADGTVKLSGRGQVCRKSTSIRDCPARGEQHKDLQGESDGPQPLDKKTGDGEARNDSWSMEGNYIFRQHVEPRVQLYVPKNHSQYHCDFLTWSLMARNLVRNVKSSQTKRKAAVGHRENEARQC